MNVGTGELIALVQKWLACHVGKRIRETVTEIQRCRVPVLAKVPPGKPRSRQVFACNRYRLNRSVLKVCAKFMPCLRTATAHNHHRRFQDIGDRHTARYCCQDFGLVAFRIGLPVQDCQ